ncbi:MAG TPA: DUF397 domain-containing protein [Streptosporangiaceae bacterium]|jgi:hypothetical protein|nr:DUF397 domain-containing protein [Streptosporangiaceae bacterium]
MSRPGHGATELPPVTWIKSSYSGPTGGNCVEAAALPDAVAVRDSKAPGGPALVFAAAAWGAFVGGVRMDATG